MFVRSATAQLDGTLAGLAQCVRGIGMVLNRHSHHVSCHLVMSPMQHQHSTQMWVPELESEYLKPHMWRKSSQWSMILRAHAEVCQARELRHQNLTLCTHALAQYDQVASREHSVLWTKRSATSVPADSTHRDYEPVTAAEVVARQQQG